MLKFLKGVVGGSGTGLKDLPYDIGEPYSSAWGSWVHYRGASEDDGSPVSIFSLSGNNANDGHLVAGRNGVKCLRTVHGNVCMASVVATETLDWKLHGFDVLSELDGNNEAFTGLMFQYEWLIGSQYKPMELSKSDWAAIRKSAPWAIDSWGLGCLIYELFSGVKLSRTEDLRSTASRPKSLLQYYELLLCSMPSCRLNPSRLLENSEYFQNQLLETIQFMEILNLKDSVEKDTFFHKLPNLAEQLPRQIVLKKLLPLLASALEFGSASAPALTALLKMGSWLSAEEYTLKILPTIVKLFASNDCAIRVSLLRHIDQYGESLSAQIVDEQVYPHIANGFSDTSASLRELTLKSMLVLAPKLSQRTISGSLLKFLSKLQVDEEPAIRTNTTILLGNIAGHLNEGTRKRVLINAFTVRALRDTFSPARGAGIMALCATSSYYDAIEIATRILPNVIVLTIDPDRWAMSSLTMKGKPSEQSNVTSSSTSEPLASSTSNANSGMEDANLMPVHVNSGTDLADLSDHPPPTSPTSTDGWGELENGTHGEHDSDKDGWDNIEPLEEARPSAALTNIQAALKRPVPLPKPQVSNSRLKNMLKTTKDDDVDL